MSNHRKIRVAKQVEINASCNAIISRRIPRKLKDPDNFTIPIKIGNLQFNRDLCDLGASINLMCLSVFEKLVLGELRNKQVILQFVDKSHVL